MEKMKDFTEGKILPQLLSFAFPVLLALFLQAMYGAVDLLVVGQFSTPEEVSAVSTGSQILHSITTVITGLAMGITVLVGQRIGEKRPEQAGTVIGNGICLFGVIAVVVTVIMVFGAEVAANIMHAPDEAFEQTAAYIRICTAGTVFIVAYNLLGSIFRGIGDSKMPLITVAIACVINIVGDLLFVAGFNMGAAGAAIATVLAQAVSFLLSVITIRKKEMGISLTGKDLKPQSAILRGILKVGVPVALQDGLIQISFIIITIIANQRGVTIAASVGIVEKIISFLFLIPSALLSSVSAIAAQNIGAGKQERARKTLYYASAIAFGCGLVLAVICNLLTEPIVGLFSKDPEVVRLGAQYLRSYAFDCAFAGIHFCFSGYFCACGYSMVSFIHNIASIVLVRVPGAYLASRLFPETLFEMGLAAPLGSLLSSLICVSVFLVLRKRKKV